MHVNQRMHGLERYRSDRDERDMGSCQCCLELLRYTGACLTLQADLNGRDDDEPDYKKRMRSTQPHPVCSGAGSEKIFPLLFFLLARKERDLGGKRERKRGKERKRESECARETDRHEGSRTVNEDGQMTSCLTCLCVWKLVRRLTTRVPDTRVWNWTTFHLYQEEFPTCHR